MRIKAITALILCGVMMTACAGKTTEQHTEQITEQNDKQKVLGNRLKKDTMRILTII